MHCCFPPNLKKLTKRLLSRDQRVTSILCWTKLKREYVSSLIESQVEPL